MLVMLFLPVNMRSYSYEMLSRTCWATVLHSMSKGTVNISRENLPLHTLIYGLLLMQSLGLIIYIVHSVNMYIQCISIIHRDTSPCIHYVYMLGSQFIDSSFHNRMNETLFFYHFFQFW